MHQDLMNGTRSGDTSKLSRDEIASLNAQMAGDVLTPSDNEFEEARHVWNGMIDAQPMLIARCRETSDVVHAVNFARARNVVVSIRGGGHNVAGTAVADGAVVIDLTWMNRVRVDPAQKLADVQGGATLGDIDRATQEHGLATPSGFVSKTGIAGLSLRGGFGHMMRRFGLACDNILSVEMVTSNGEVMRMDDENNPDLMWALRGGPLDLGVVTSFQFRLYPVGPDVRLIVSVYPYESGMQINRFVREYMRDAPEELGLITFYGTAPDDDALPESLRGQPAIFLFGLYTGSQAEAENVIAPLLEIDTPVGDLGGWITYVEAQSSFDEEYPDGRRYYWKSLYFDELPDDAIEAIHRLAGERPSPLTTLDVWHMGGAIRKDNRATSSFPQRDAQYMIAIEANWEDASDDEANVAWARQAWEELKRYSNDGVYMNFPGSREEHAALAQNVYASSYKRLVELQTRVDPVGLFRNPG
jgi:hypothetical protein